MPVQYKSILEEHRAVRNAAGLFDVSHMGEIAVRGPRASGLIDRLVTNDVSKLDPGRVLYSPMCNAHGGVIDDLLVYKRGEDDFLICVNASNSARDFEWIRSQAGDSGCEVKDESLQWGLLAIQGPAAEVILQQLTDADLSGIRYYHFAEGEVTSVSCIISRTGYTGEAGFELFCPWTETGKLAVAFEQAGAAHGLALCGLGARDSLRLEAGYSLYGHEITESISPLQAGLDWTVKFAKADFVGRDALLAEKNRGPASRVLFFRTGDRRIARSGTSVLAGEETVGTVLSGTLSPVLNEAIGSALVASGHCHDALSVDLRGQRFGLQIVKPPFIPLKK